MDMFFQTLQRPPIPAHLRAMRWRPLPSTIPIRNHVRFLHGESQIPLLPPKENARAQGVQGCAAKVWICGMSHNHESHGCHRIQGMRARCSKFAMAALPETTWEEHDVCCRGGEIIAATHFPAETSCRILVRTRGFDSSYLAPNFVPSTQPRNPR